MKGQWGRMAGYFVGTLVVSCILTLGLPLLGGGSWLPDLISAEGRAIDNLFWALLWMSLVIFAIVSTIIVYSLVHFRAEPGELDDGEYIHGNLKMELGWIIVPSIIVIVISAVSYKVLQDNEIGLYDQADAKARGAATMQVDVRAFSFGWAFRYLDREGKALAGTEQADPSPELVLPVDEVVKFNVLSCSGQEALGRVREQVRREMSAGDHETEFADIPPGICEREWDSTTAEEREQAEAEQRQVIEARRAKAEGRELSAEQQELLEEQPEFRGDDQYVDVIHAFWVPEARLKIDAVYGIPTYVQWKPIEVTGPTDRFQVVCAELCGDGHNAMRTEMCIVDRATFDWWLGLDEEQRRDATCVNLRLFSCIDDAGDRDELLSAMAKLTKDDPRASCDAAREVAA